MSHFTPESVIEYAYLDKILPQFDFKIESIQWNGHTVIGPDSTGHFFFNNNQEFLLIYEDYPSLTEEEISELVQVGKRLIPIKPSVENGDDLILDYESDESNSSQLGLSGSFRLYKIA